MARETADHEVYDYEEGEILDDELDVSVCSEDLNSPEQVVLLAASSKQNCFTGCRNVPRGDREHICHESSVCRNERSGKRCFARIQRKIESRKSEWHENDDRNKNEEGHKIPAKDLSLTRTVYQENKKGTTGMPSRKRFEKPPPCEEENKSNQGKENNCFGRPTYPFTYKRQFSSFVSQRYRFQSRRVTPYTRGRRRPKSSSPVSAHKNGSKSIQKPLKKSVKTTPEMFKCRKTSLLKRLVGSGSTGVKTPKESEMSEACLKTRCENSGSGEKSPPPKRERAEEEGGAAEGVPEAAAAAARDEDEEALYLRVEALRTAIIRKHNERKRRGVGSKKPTPHDGFYQASDYPVSPENRVGDARKREEEEEGVTASEAAAPPGENLFAYHLFVNGEKDAGGHLHHHFLPHPLPNGLSLPATTPPTRPAHYTRPEIDRSNLIPCQGGEEAQLPPLKFTLQPRPKKFCVPGNVLENLVGKKYKWDSPPPSDGAPTLSSAAGLRESADTDGDSDTAVVEKPAEVVRISSSSDEENDEEIKLRELALLSFRDKDLAKRKNSGKEGLVSVEEEKLVSGKEESGAEVGGKSPVAEDVSAETVGEEEIAGRSGQEGAPPRGDDGAESQGDGEGRRGREDEDWEELDEDILRAQLLTSLSKKIPVSEDCKSLEKIPVPPPVQKVKRKRAERNGKGDKKWKRGTVEVKQQQQHALPLPPARFIISVDDDSSDSTEDELSLPTPADIETSVDKLLSEARKKIPLKKPTQEEPPSSSSSSYPLNGASTPLNVACKTQAKANCVAVKKKQDKTPTAVKHLSTPKQQEYRQLKLHLAKREQRKKLVLLKKQLHLLYSKVAHKKNSDKTTAREKLKLPSLPQKNNSGVPKVLNSNSIACSTPVQGTEKSVKCEEKVRNPIVNSLNSVKAPTKSNIERTETSLKEKELLESKEFTLHNTRSIILMGIGKMSDLVEKMEKEKAEYISLQQEVVHLKEELASIEIKLNEQTAKIFDKKDSLMGFERIITKEVLKSSSLEESCVSLGQKIKGPGYKPPGEETDVIKGKIVDILARADALCINLPKKDLSPGKILTGKRKSQTGTADSKRKKISVPDRTVPLMKKEITVLKAVDGEVPPLTTDSPMRVVNKSAQCDEGVIKKSTNQLFTPSCVESRTGKWDPLWAVCPFDISGTCRDPECKYQHFKPSDE